jgi:hypothetical protein
MVKADGEKGTLRPVVIFEGGARGNDQHKRGLKEFLDRCCGSGPKAKVVMGFGRTQAANAFVDRREQGQDVFLLIDSEGPLTQESVSTVIGERLEPFSDRVFFMVQVMEAWFIADSAALDGIKNVNKILLDDELRSHNGKIQTISKSKALDLFAKATHPHECSSDSGKGARLAYLARLNIESLRAASPAAARLIEKAEQGWV